MSEKSKILLVDDAPENLQILVAALKADYKLVVASSGEKALKLAQRTPAPDMILLDVMMPGIDGYEVCARLKRDTATRDIPVIFVTALTEAGDEERGLELGAVDYITKPISPPIVRARVRTQLALRHSMEKLQQAYGIIQAQKERMQRELDVGHKIQMSMLPVSFPQREDLEVFATLEPAREVGGDFYDCFFVDRQRLCFSIGDVSDKGVPSALLMAMTKTMIKSRAATDGSTASIITYVNQELCADNDACMFVTLFLGILDLDTGELISTNAGHNPPLLRRADGSTSWLSRRDGPVVGALPDLTFREGRITLEPGDTLLLYTDGVTEAIDAREDLFTAPRLERLFANSRAVSMRGLVAEVQDAVKAFESGVPQADDITILALRLNREGGSQRRFATGLANDPTQILTVNRDFARWARREGIPEQESARAQMAFDELLTNVIAYAYEDDAPHEIQVSAELFHRRLIIRVEDDGRPFDPSTNKNPDLTLPAEQKKVGGLGIFMLKKVFDRVVYERSHDRNRVRLEKYLQCTKVPSA